MTLLPLRGTTVRLIRFDVGNMGPRLNIFQGLQLTFSRPACEYTYPTKIPFFKDKITHAWCLITASTLPASTRCFSTTSPSFNWLIPKHREKRKSQKGRPRMPTGGSSRGTTVIWGDYGLRMRDHDRRVSAEQLRIGFETIQKRLRGMKYKFYPRVAANIGVYTSGNEQRMGKGKGKFDYWAARVAVSRIIFELKGDLHEKVAREAFRLAAAKMPGMFF